MLGSVQAPWLKVVALGSDSSEQIPSSIIHQLRKLNYSSSHNAHVHKTGNNCSSLQDQIREYVSIFSASPHKLVLNKM